MHKNCSHFIILVGIFFLISFSLDAQQTQINTDFSDGSWGELMNSKPESGTFPSFDANGFSIKKGVLHHTESSCDGKQKHINRIILDKNSQHAYIKLPVLTNVGILEVHASTGSENRSFIVQERVGRTWEKIGTYLTREACDSIYLIPLHRAKTEVRIANNTGSSLFIWQIKTTVESAEVIADYEKQRPVITNYVDGTWGRPSSKKPESGDFPSFEANGFKINHGFLNSGSTICAESNEYKHSGRIYLDKDKYDSSIEFPELEMVGDVEIHAATGSDDRSFTLQEFDGNHWKTIATFSTGKKERVFKHAVDKEKTTLRIRNNTGSGLMIYQIKIFKTDVETIERKAKLAGLDLNFGDGTWGSVTSKRPESGDYPTFDANDFWIYSGVVYKTSSECPQGGKHRSALILDKDKEMARIDFPKLTDVGEIEIHASTGSDQKSFEVLEKVGRKWVSLGIFNTTKKEQIYVIPIHKDLARIRIRNNTLSALNIYQVKMRTMTALNSLMLQASSPAKDELIYSNLQRKILLQFNKEISLGEAPLLLNGDTIDASKIKVKGNIASIRVRLKSGKSHKAYSLEIPHGAFVTEMGIFCEKSSLSFKAHKVVSVPEGYKSELDAIYSNANIMQNRVDIYSPKSIETPVPVVINIHGGGWNHGEKESQTGFNFFFEHGFAVANMEYRMTPQANAPAAVEDVRCVIQYIAQNAKRLNIDPHKIILCGGSAGGHLALAAGYLGKSSVYDKGMFTGSEFTIAAVIDKYGPADLSNFMHFASLKDWLGGKASDQAFVESISPVHLVDTNTPPTYIIHGDADPTVAYNQSILLENALKESGVIYQFRTIAGGKHGGFSNETKKIMENDLKAFFMELKIIEEK